MKSDKHVKDQLHESHLKLSETTLIREKEQSFKLIFLAQKTLGYDRQRLEGPFFSPVVCDVKAG